MNDSFQRLMREATQLTQNGQLADATQAIQRALRNGMSLNADSDQGRCVTPITDGQCWPLPDTGPATSVVVLRYQEKILAVV